MGTLLLRPPIHLTEVGTEICELVAGDTSRL